MKAAMVGPAERFLPCLEPKPPQPTLIHKLWAKNLSL
jgi:hypothetical protein